MWEEPAELDSPRVVWDKTIEWNWKGSWKRGTQGFHRWTLMTSESLLKVLRCLVRVDCLWKLEGLSTVSQLEWDREHPYMIKINVRARREQPQDHELQGVRRSLWESFKLPQAGRPLGLLLLLVYLDRTLGRSWVNEKIFLNHSHIGHMSKSKDP